MGFSLTHLLIIGLIVLLVLAPRRLTDLGKSMGQFTRNFKKGLHGEEDIDITGSVKKEIHSGNEVRDAEYEDIHNSDGR